MKHFIVLALTFLSLAACSSMTHFVYYEPHADGWKLEHAARGEPDDEVVFRGNNYAVSISAMTLNINLQSVGPQYLPIIPVGGSNSVRNFYAPDTMSIYMQFFLSSNVQVDANIDFSGIKLQYDNQETIVRSVYLLPKSTLQKKALVNMQQVIGNPTKYQEEHGQFPSYEIVFPWTGEKPETFSVIIPLKTIRISGESVPATVIYFKKKSVSKYQYFQ